MGFYAADKNLPIFKKKIIKQNDKFYIKGKVGSDSFLGIMSSTPRKEYYAYVDSFNDRIGNFRIGRIEYTKVNKLKLVEGDSILIEVISDRHGNYIPNFINSLQFTNRQIKLSFSDWIKFIN